MIGTTESYLHLKAPLSVQFLHIKLYCGGVGTWIQLPSVSGPDIERTGSKLIASLSVARPHTYKRSTFSFFNIIQMSLFLFTQQLLDPLLHLYKTCELMVQTPYNTLRRILLSFDIWMLLLLI